MVDNEYLYDRHQAEQDRYEDLHEACFAEMDMLKGENNNLRDTVKDMVEEIINLDSIEDIKEKLNQLWIYVEG